MSDLPVLVCPACQVERPHRRLDDRSNHPGTAVRCTECFHRWRYHEPLPERRNWPMPILNSA